MRKLHYIAAIFAALAFVSCGREEMPAQEEISGQDEHGVEQADGNNDGQQDPGQQDEGGVEIKAGDDGTLSITMGFDNPLAVAQPTETRSHVSGGSKVYWSSGDNTVYVFDSMGGKNAFTSTETTVQETRTFTGTITSGSEIEYILYTGKKQNETDNSTRSNAPGGPVENEEVTAGNGGSLVEWDLTRAGGLLSRNLFSGSTLRVVNPQHIATTNTFASTANIAILRRGDAALKNVFGYIRFTVPKGADGNAAIKSVQFSADENMAGQIQIDYGGEDPVTTIVADGSKSITVNMRWNANTSRYEDGTLFAVLPAGTYNNLHITITPFINGASTQDAETGTPFTLSAARPVTIKRGQYTDCGILPAAQPESSAVFGQIVQLLPKGTSVGGICVDSANNVLYVGVGGQIQVYDITIPMSPVLKKTVTIYGNPRQIRAYNKKLYVTARETGAWVYDISKPLQPSLLKRYDTAELATGLDVAGNCMFIGQRQNGVEFVDISTPSKPQHIRLIDTDESQSVFYRNGYLYSGEWSGKVTIFNAKNLNNIQKLKTIDLQGYGDGLWISGNRLYVSTGHHTPSTQNAQGHGVEIWDVTDLENPRFISRAQFDTFYQSGTDCWLPRPSGDGKTLFCGDVFNGLYVVDIEDETQPDIIAHYTLSDNSAVTSIDLAEGVVYMATTKDGLLAMKCARARPCTRDRGTLPSNATARYDYTTSTSRYVAWKPTKRGIVHSVAAWGDALFVACGDAGLYVVKVTRTSSWWNTTVTPSTYATVNLPFAGDVAIHGDRLYVSQGQEGIGVYQISEGPVLTRIATIKEELSPEAKERYSCWVSAPNDKYVVNGLRYGSGYQFLALGGTDENPTFTYRGNKSRNVNYNKYISEQVCGQDRLPYATRDGLYWIDLSSPDQAPVSSLITDIKSSIPCGVTQYKNGDALITASGEIYRVQSGASVKAQTASLSVSGIPRWDGNNTVILTHLLGRKFSKVDLSNFASPSVVYTEENLSGNPKPGIFVDGKAIIPCGYQGLLIEK